MINIIDFSNVEIDGVKVGDCIAASANYPDKSADILAALVAYDTQRQGQADDAATQAEIEAHTQQIADLKSQLQSAQQTIEQQRTQLSALVITDWPGLMDDLKVAGFNRWLADAGNTNPDLLDEVARLYAAAKSGDRTGVIAEFLAIINAYPATPEKLQDWQAVLDARGIPKNLLAFVP